MPTSNHQHQTPSCTATLAVDFETYYDRDYSLKKMDAWSYVHHPKFDGYLMSVFGTTPSGPISWCGHPKDFEGWHHFDHATLLAHNAAFDSLVFQRLQSLGIIPSIESPTWRCTASLAVYLSAPRSLKGACKQLLGIAVDKSQRDKAKGQTGADLFGNEAMKTYALEDARLCFLLWDKFSHLWPETEQELATLTFEWGQQGVAVDLPRLKESIRTLDLHRFNAVQELPWVEDIDEDTPLSHRKLAEECRSAGIPCPASLAMDDPDCEAWENKYGSEYAWVDAMRIFRRTNILIKRFKTVYSRTNNADLGIRFPYALKYFGAVPGRWSGDAGFNVQNMPRGELFDVDLRRCFIPSPGNVFIIADLCQIEPRILAWLVDDTAFLDLVRNGVDIYEAHARSTMGYTDPSPLKEVDPAMRSLAKARTLGLGYGCGSRKFVAVAKNLGGIDITLAEAKQTVQDFRAKNRRITRLWNQLDRAFKRSAGGDYHIELPSGRELRYMSVSKSPRGYYTATTERGGRMRKLYGGLLTENLVQATARDVFAEQLLAIHRYLTVPQASCLPCRTTGDPSPDRCPPTSPAIGRIVFHVHDEVIVEVPESLADQVRTEILTIMSIPPDWLPGCPIEAEATVNHHYTK